MIVYNAELGIRKELGVGNRKINELLAVYTYTANMLLGGGGKGGPKVPPKVPPNYVLPIYFIRKIHQILLYKRFPFLWYHTTI